MPSRLHRAWFVVVALLLLTPNCIAIGWPIQQYPWDSAPMFGVRLDDETALHRLTLIVEPDETELKTGVLGGDVRYFIRLFFAHSYGSTIPNFPDGKFPDDTPAAFEARLTDFFSRLHSELHKRRGLPRRFEGIRVEAVRVDQKGKAIDDVHIVGRYDATTRKFTHLWRAIP